MYEKLATLFAQIQVSPSDLDIPQNSTLDDSNVSNVLSLVFAVAAGVALIAIIVAGIQFMLSQGDPGKSNNARNAIIYSCVGLGLSAGAFAVVRLVAGSLG